MVAPPFPLLLIFPALAIDLVLFKADRATGWKSLGFAMILGAVFVAVFIPTQWFFAEFMISPHAANWFFGGDRIWSYGNHLGDWNHTFWRVDAESSEADPLNLRALAIIWLLAAVTSWLGLLLGGWMRKVQR
jgi:hypothetical protein